MAFLPAMFELLAIALQLDGENFAPSRDPPRFPLPPRYGVFVLDYAPLEGLVPAGSRWW